MHVSSSLYKHRPGRVSSSMSLFARWMAEGVPVSSIGVLKTFDSSFNI